MARFCEMEFFLIAAHLQNAVTVIIACEYKQPFSFLASVQTVIDLAFQRDIIKEDLAVFIHSVMLQGNV